MSKAKHTPGPWMAVGCLVEVLSDSIPDICSTNPDTFGQHGRSDKERFANARLIAAAPELLQSCNALLQWIDAEAAHFGAATPDDYILLPARAAVAKAMGEK